MGRGECSASSGELPAGFNEWQRGLVYTARPAIPSPLLLGQQYRITAGVKQRIVNGDTFNTYHDLYQWATTLANARIAELTSPGPLHVWIVSHGWRCLGDPHGIACAFLTVGLACPRQGDARPEGECAPTADELTRPGGATLEILTAQRAHHVDEIYSEFDVVDPAGAPADIFTFSCGERAPGREEIDFAPFIERAENRARLHFDFLKSRSGSRVDSFRIVRREWWRTTNPDLVVVMVYFRI
jgi:hypothetical protein